MVIKFSIFLNFFDGISKFFSMFYLSPANNFSKLFDTQTVFLKELFEKVDFEKSQQTTKKPEKFPRGQNVNIVSYYTFVSLSCIVVYHYQS